MDIQNLVAFLSEKNVESFEGYGVKISFKKQIEKALHDSLVYGTGAVRVKPDGVEHIPFKDLTSVAAEAPMGLSQSIDGEMEYDRVLNWSASPDATPTETPLTGDATPLTSHQE